VTEPARLRDVETTSRPPLRRRALRSLERALGVCGAAGAYVRLARVRGAVVLMYHSVPDGEAARWIDPRNAVAPDVFRAQMRFLAAHRRVVSMTRLADLLDAGEAPEPGTVVLTFDDGYLDNLEVVAPVLAELGLPATLFLPTAYVAGGEIQWVDRLYAAFRARSRSRLARADGAASETWNLDASPDARAAYASLCATLIDASREERRRILDSVDEQLAPSASPPRLTLDWSEVRRIVARFPGFEIGGHSVGHVNLARLDAESCRREILGCAKDIERETGRRPDHFSFPYGRATREACRIAAECGFRAAVADGEDVLIRSGHDLHALPRIEAPASPASFRFRTSGAYPGLLRTLVGRA